MKKEELELLLTVARILRARLKHTFEETGNRADLEDLNDMRAALAPFDALDTEPVNEAAEH